MERTITVFVTIHDVTKNVEQIFENVNYSGPQLIWNRYGKQFSKELTTSDINNIQYQVHHLS